MTPDEARAFLRLHLAEAEDDRDRFDTLLFNIRQFALQKPALQSLFASRMSQLQQLHQVGEALGFLTEETQPDLSFETFGTTVAEVFHQYQAQKNQLQALLVRSNNPQHMLLIIQAAIARLKAYAACWYNPQSDTTGVLVSREPDPMLVLRAIQQFNQSGKTRFDELSVSGDEVPPLLSDEQKRLSLLHKSF